MQSHHILIDLMVLRTRATSIAKNLYRIWGVSNLRISFPFMDSTENFVARKMGHNPWPSSLNFVTEVALNGGDNN